MAQPIEMNASVNQENELYIHSRIIPDSSKVDIIHTGGLFIECNNRIIPDSSKVDIIHSGGLFIECNSIEM